MTEQIDRRLIVIETEFKDLKEANAAEHGELKEVLGEVKALINKMFSLHVNKEDAIKEHALLRQEIGELRSRQRYIETTVILGFLLSITLIVISKYL